MIFRIFSFFDKFLFQSSFGDNVTQLGEDDLLRGDDERPRRRAIGAPISPHSWAQGRSGKV